MPLYELATQAEPREGVYALLWYLNSYLVLLSLPSEDTELGGGKAEGDLHLDDQLTKLTPDMLSTVSGGVKRESHFDAIVRETLQETGLSLHSRDFRPMTNPEAVTDTIQWRKGKGLYHIKGSGFSTELTPRGLSVVEQYAKREGRTVELTSIEALAAMDKAKLRPFFYAAVAQVLATQREMTA